MIRKVPLDSPDTRPALILASGIAADILGGSDDSYPEGTCFFASASHVVTARHCGDILRSELSSEGLRPKAGVQPYGQHVFDPRLGLTWKVLNEMPWQNADISFLQVAPEIDESEDASGYLPWCQIWEDQDCPEHPIIRMSPVTSGEQLCFCGFTDIKFGSSTTPGKTKRLNQEVSATGVVGRGKAAWQDMESAEGIRRRLVIESVAAKALNSGSPILDAKDRIVGIVSQSPQDEYTVIAPFYCGQVGPMNGGRHLTKWSLKSPSSGDEAEVAVLCDWG